MIEMSPAFAHESKVGPVFDITSWSSSKNLWMGLVALVFAAIALAIGVFLWAPQLMEGKMPAGTENVVTDLIAARRTHLWPLRGGIAAASFFGWFFAVVAISTLHDVFCGNYYLRAGSGGISLRVPNGISLAHGGLISAVLELDLPWEGIRGLTVVQTKQLGSLSRNAGNIGAEMRIAMHSGQTHHINLDGFEAAAYLIHERLNEAQEMVPADLNEPRQHDAAV